VVPAQPAKASTKSSKAPVESDKPKVAVKGDADSSSDEEDSEEEEAQIKKNKIVKN